MFCIIVEVPRDILSGDLDLPAPPQDDLSMLNDILGGDTANDEFSPEWQEMFGQSVKPKPTAPTNQPTEATPTNAAAANQQQFLPSQLLDMNQQMASMSMASNATGNTLP